MPYSSELKALQKSKLLRTKTLHSNHLLDFASNDYLGLSENKILLQNAYMTLQQSKSHAPMSSMALCGYHPIHQTLENFLTQYFGFESCILFGSGFLANIALFDTLVRKNDLIFIDELYHASGRLPAKLLGNQAIYFSHNNPQDLREKLLAHSPYKGRILIAIEGVYSMDGDVAKIDFAHIAKEFGALLIVDEAHSSGILGENLKGYFDYHHLSIKPNFIKMGTLSKAYGSYGAFVLAQKNIIDFLFSKAKSAIYTTAPSLFDIALAYENLCFIANHTPTLHNSLLNMRQTFQPITPTASQIAIIPFVHQDKMIQTALILQEAGFLVGAIRKPTSATPRLRISLNLKNSIKQTQKLCKILQKILEA